MCLYIFVHHTFFCWQAEIADTQRELKDLLFKEEVLRKEKELLEKFANHVSKIHSVKVNVLSLYICAIVCHVTITNLYSLYGVCGTCGGLATLYLGHQIREHVI